MGEHPWSADFDLTDAEVAEILRRRFPDLADAPVSYFAEGWDFRAYAVDDRLLFRMPKREDPTPRLDAEGSLLRVLAERLDIRVPVPLFRGEPDSDFPWAFAGHEMIDGLFASEADLSLTDLRSLAIDLARTFGVVHTAPFDAVEPALAVWPADIAVQDVRDTTLETLAVIGDRASSPLIRTALHLFTDPSLVPASPTIDLGPIHGDPTAEHVLLDPDTLRLSGIIDWSDCCVGDPAHDLARLAQFLPPDYLDLAIDGDDREQDAGLRDRVRYIAAHAALEEVRYGLDGWSEGRVESGLRALGWALRRPPSS